ncbi:MAG TPA: hypothetical protein EYH39_03435 [Desulfurobacteriaceae bacterium]|nr:hypothetical protein [Desulfurobacteriaceae bacterium]
MKIIISGVAGVGKSTLAHFLKNNFFFLRKYKIEDYLIEKLFKGKKLPKFLKRKYLKKILKGIKVYSQSFVVKKYKLYSFYDKKRKSFVVNEEKFKEFFKHKENFILEGVASHLVSTKDSINIVLYTSPKKILFRLIQRKYPFSKIKENIEAQKLDYHLNELYKKNIKVTLIKI